jgi:hypothetical protein
LRSSYGKGQCVILPSMLKIVKPGDGGNTTRTERVRLSASGHDWKYLFIAVGELCELPGHPQFFDDVSAALSLAIFSVRADGIPEDDEFYSLELDPADCRDFFQCIMNLCNGLSRMAEREDKLSTHQEGKKLAKMLNPLMKQADSQGWDTAALAGLAPA